MRLSSLFALVLCVACAGDPDTSASSPPIVLYPSGMDDGPMISAALEFGPVTLAADRFIVRTPIVVPSGAKLTADPRTTIYSDLVGSGPGGYEQATFYAAARVGEYRSVLVVDAVQGQTSIETLTPPEKGAWIRVSNPLTQNVAQVFQVVSVDGATVHLDRRVQYARAFRAYSLVEEVDPPRDIQLLGNGATIVGTGDRAFELSATQRSTVQGWNVRGLFQSIVMSFDIGSADSYFRDISIDGGMTAAAGVALESCYRCAILEATVRNTRRGSSNPGVYVVDSVDSTVTADVADCGVGIQLASGSTNDPTSAGSRNVTVSGRFNSSEHFGALVTTPEVEFRDASFSSNRRSAVSVDFGTERNRPSGGPVVLFGVQGDSNGGPLLAIRGGSVIAVHLQSRNDGLAFQGHAIELGVGVASLDLKNSTLTLDEDRFWRGLYTAGSGNVTIDSSIFVMPPRPSSASAGIVIEGANFTRVSNSTIDGGYFGVYVFGNGATLSLDSNVNVDSTHPLVVQDGSTLVHH